MSFPSPNYTQVPNSFFEVDMRNMGEAELRVVLVVTRKTIGYHKESDPISWSQIMDMSGLSKSGTQDGIDQAITHGYIEQCGVGQRGVAVYRLVVSDDQTNQNTGVPVTPELVASNDPQKKDLNKAIHTGSRARRDLLRQITSNADTVVPPEMQAKILMESIAKSALAEYVSLVFGKTFTIDKATANAMSSKVTVKTNAVHVVYPAPIDMYDSVPAFKRFVEVRCASLKAVPNMTPLNAMKNLCKIGFNPYEIPGNEKKMPGYHVWLQKNQAVVSQPETIVEDLGVPDED